MTRKKRLPQFESKVEEIKRVKTKLLEVRSKEKMREEGNKLRMAMMRKSKAKELTDNIFSIEQVGILYNYPIFNQVKEFSRFIGN